MTRPYADALLNGAAPPPPAQPKEDADDDGDDDDEAWRWERERKSQDERVYDAVRSLLVDGNDNGCVFLKQMAKFSNLFDFDVNWEKAKDTAGGEWREKCRQLLLEYGGVEVRHCHLLLIRDPVSVLSSWMGKSGTVHGNNVHPDEVGISSLMDAYTRIVGSSMMGRHDDDGGVHDEGDEFGYDGTSPSPSVVVIDSDDLAMDPRGTMNELCDALDIDYHDDMLKWKSGPHHCDGPWGKSAYFIDTKHGPQYNMRIVANLFRSSPYVTSSRANAHGLHTPPLTPFSLSPSLHYKSQVVVSRRLGERRMGRPGRL